VLADSVNSEGIPCLTCLGTHWALVTKPTDVSLNMFLNCISKLAAIMTLSTLPDSLAEYRVV